METWLKRKLNGAAHDAATGLAKIPSEVNVHIKIKSDPIPSMPNDNTGQAGKGQAYMTGGFTGVGAADQIAGVVHFNELVLPQHILDAGIPAVMWFIEQNMPNGLEDVGISPSTPNMGIMPINPPPMTGSPDMGIMPVSPPSDLDRDWETHGAITATKAPKRLPLTQWRRAIQAAI